MKSVSLLQFLVLHSVFILMNRTCQSQKSSSGSERNHKLLPRAAEDNFNVIINQMKILARVSNAIVLTQQLIAGNVPSDILFSELLKMGNVTVSQLKALDTQKITDSVNAMRNLPWKFKNDTKVKKVELGYEKQIEIGKELDNITEYNTWPEKDTFNTTMNTIKDIQIYPPKFLNMKLLLYNIKIYTELLGTTNKTGEIKKMINYIKKEMVNLSIALDNFPTNLDDPDFNTIKITGLEKMATLFAVAKKYESIDFVDWNDAGFNQNVDNLPNAEKDIQTGLTELQIIGNILENRRKNPALNSLIYTTGFQKGLEDIRFLSGDLNSEWMSKVINSTSLETALKILQQLHTPLIDANAKFEMTGTAVITNEIDKLLSLSSFNSDPIKIKTVVTALNACDVKNNRLLIGFDANVYDWVKELEDLLMKKKNAFIEYGNQLKASGIKSHLEQMKTMCEEAEKKNWTEIEADQTKILNFTKLTGLDILYDNYVEEFKSRDQQIVEEVKNILSDMKDIQPYFLDRLNDKKDILNCLKQMKDKKLLYDAISTIQKIRNSEFPDFEITLPFVEYIRSVSDEYDKFKRVVDGIKGKMTKETNGLSLLKDQLSIKNMEISVQLMDRMNELISGRYVEFELNITIISTEMANVQLDTQDRINLNNLITLSPKFQSLKTDLYKWRETVKYANSNTISDYKDFFIQSSKVNGISEDLRPMIESLQVLIEKCQNRDHKRFLNTLKFKLQKITSIGLDFATYSGSFASATAALPVLDTFFKKYSEKRKIHSSDCLPKERPYTSKYAPCGPCTPQTGIIWPQWASNFILVSLFISALLIILFHCTKL